MFHRKETELPQEKRDKLAAARAVDQRLAGRKILIVDDDLRNLFALTSALETHDMNLTLAENGRKGIEALRANPDVELVLMDIMLPEMDGYQAMRAIRKMPEYRELPVIALTAQAMKGDRERCIEAGATDYIAKPVEIDQLLALMRVWLPEAQKAAERIVLAAEPAAMAGGSTCPTGATDVRTDLSWWTQAVPRLPHS